MPEEIVEKLKNVRIKKGLTQGQLAKLLDTSQAQISFFESGKQSPTWETIKRVSKALGVKVKIK